MYQIKNAKKSLKAGIQGYLLKDEKGNYRLDKVQRLPFYLEGSPGIGKTQIVSQIAEELGIGFVSFSITHHTRNSLLGLPVVKDVPQGSYTEYTMSEILAKVYEQKQKGFEEGILLLDEFACISETLMPAMLAFLQTKNIGMYTLPDGWLIVLCGNPPEYNRSARRFDAAITDRMRRLEIQYSFKDFLEYAQKKKFHESIISYLEKHPADVYHCAQNGSSQEIVTCRSWENLSHAIRANECLGEKVDLEFVRQFIKQDAIAAKFSQFYEVLLSGVTDSDIRKILAGENLLYYRGKWEKKSAKYWLNILDMLKKAMEENKKDCLLVCEQINHVFQLLSGVKWEKSLKDQLYDAINESDILLHAVSQQRSDEYLAVGRQRYAL